MLFEEVACFPCSTVAQAARYGKLEEIQRLIDEGHPVDVADNRGWRSIHEAADGNYLDCLQYLLQRGQTDANWQSFEGITALHMACEQGNIEAVSLLLDHGADPNLHDHMETYPLFTAVKCNKTDIARLLMGHGARVNVQLYCGTSPLHQAASEGMIDMTQLLLDSDARLDIREEYDITPIFSAAQYGQRHCLKLLLDKARETGELHLVDSPADDGATALYLAAQEGHISCVKLLLQYRANANTGPKQPKALPLHAALQFNHLQCVQELLPHTDKAHLSDCDLSLFYFATSHKDTKCLQALLRAGISPSLRHKSEEEEFKPRILRYFMSSVIYSQRFSPLALLAILRHPLENAKVLLDRGAILDARTPYEVPPLLAALETRRIELAEMLIRHGAKLNIYHPMIMSNMTILLTRFHWKALNLVLKAGAEAESLFLSHPVPAKQLTPDEAKEAEIEDDMNQSVDENYEQEMGLLSYPVPFWRNLAEARVPNGLFTASQFVRRVLCYVGTVCIDPRLAMYMDNVQDFKEICAIGAGPRSLSHLCRLTIRRQMTSIQLLDEHDLHALPLPEPVISFLLYDELET